jgi:hypothetical protein
VFCNKSEAKAARDVDEIQSELQISAPPGGNTRVSAVTLHPQKTASPGTPDPNIDSALEWLFDCIAGDFENIKARLVEDVEKERIREAKEKAEKDRRVLTKSLCKAFGKDVETGGEGPVEDVFSVEDGHEFLAQEIGFLKAEELVEEGREICEIVGYQKLAMMMVGGMFAPISSKKRKWTWPEIKAHVLEVKAEIGL